MGELGCPPRPSQYIIKLIERKNDDEIGLTTQAQRENNTR